MWLSLVLQKSIQDFERTPSTKKSHNAIAHTTSTIMMYILPEYTTYLGILPGYTAWVYCLGILPGYTAWVYCLGILPGYTAWVNCLGILPGYTAWVYCLGILPGYTAWVYCLPGYTTWVYCLGILPGLIKKVGSEARYKTIPNMARKRSFNFTMSPTADGPVSL